MAKRSDFAQKLLDDLRLRKERLATSQNSTHSKTQSRDPYGYSKQTFRGSLEEHGKAAIRSSSMQSKSVGRQSSVSQEQSSNQIVPFQKRRGSQQIGDFSMALAFALQNGGKLKRVDSSMLTFLHQIGGGAAKFNKMTRNTGSTSRVPTLTHLHVKEISRGAAKLNQILSACSNGLNFDQYSIKIGNELLKGAMDLQDSLRMLVDLQEASDVMVNPQRKNRIVLLEDGEEDEALEQKQKQLDLPRFSFDKPGRYFQLPTLVNSMNSTSHMRSVSYGDDKKQDNVLGSPQPKAEKGRISNVIAKLMGLEEGIEDKTTKLKSVGKKDGINLVTTVRVSLSPVETSFANNRAQYNLLSKPIWKKPEKMDRSVHQEKKNDRVKLTDGKRTQEKVSPSNQVKQRRKVEPTKKANVVQKSNAEEERKQQKSRQKKGTEMASKVLSKVKPYNGRVTSRKEHLCVAKTKGVKKPHGAIQDVVNPLARSVTPLDVFKVATLKTVSKSLKSRKDNLNGSEELCRETSVEIPNVLVTAARKLDKDAVHDQDMGGREIRTSDDSFERISSNVSNDSESREVAFGKDREPESAKVTPSGTLSETTTRTSNFQPSYTPDLLTEFEVWFKCLLLESRLFVDTTNALFKLNISAEIPTTCREDYRECDRKLVLDCGYEIMKRKGRLQDQTFRPFMSVHLSLMKIVSLDNLVKKLTNDFEKLKQYGRNKTSNCEDEDYVPKMLECDIHVRDPEINSMWDSGWNDEVLAFIGSDEVVKDVEKQLLAGLIEEATRDLLHI